MALHSGRAGLIAQYWVSVIWKIKALEAGIRTSLFMAFVTKAAPFVIYNDSPIQQTSVRRI
jgi:hypothetical protein